MKQQISYVPKVNLHAFATSNSLKKTFNELIYHVALEQATFQQGIGGISEAIDYFVNNPAPDILLIEENDSENLIQLLRDLATVLDGETELILLGADNNIQTYKSLKLLGVFEYLLNDATCEELLLSIQGAALNTRSGAIGEVISLLPVCSATSFDDIVFNLLKVVKTDGKHSILLLDLNLSSGNTDLVFGLDENTALAELFEKRNINKVDVEQICREVHNNLYLASNSNDLSVHLDDNLEKVAVIIGYLRELYDYIMVILPPGWQKLHSHMIARSDHVILVSEDYLNSFRDLVRVSLYLNGNNLDHIPTQLVVNCKRAGATEKIILQEMSETLKNFAPIFISSLPSIIEKTETSSGFNFSAELEKSSHNSLCQLLQRLGLEYAKASRKNIFDKVLEVLKRH